MTSQKGKPDFRELLWATLRALKAIGGSGTISEITEKATELGGFSREQQEVLHRNGPMPDLDYRFAWARNNLKTIGALENSSRGVWALTESGRSLTRADMDDVRKKLYALDKQRRLTAPSKEDVEEGAEGDTERWKDQLLQVILKMPPDRFEHLAQRLLREEDFISVRVTGRRGDEGIDGMGVYRQSLFSFRVFFQCKRYRGSVGAPAVRDFRGAMQGRGEKGLLITTGTFTPDAMREAAREGAPPVDLIDGSMLCDLLKEHRLGVSLVEKVEINAGFFAEI